jgi:hypothetical protein
MDFLGFSVNQKRVGSVVRLAFCPLAQQVNQRGRSSRRIEESVLHVLFLASSRRALGWADPPAEAEIARLLF